MEKVMDKLIEFPVWPTKYAKSWPDNEICRVGSRIRNLPPSQLFTELFETDAHFAAYSTPNNRRLSINYFQNGELPTPPQMHALIIDIDGPGHKIDESWKVTFSEQVKALPTPIPFGYFTKGGARLVWLLDQPFTIANERDSITWKKAYLRVLLSVYKYSGIVGDPSCSDWTRLFRAPHTMRDGEMQKHGWVCGDHRNIGIWNDLKLETHEYYELVHALAVTHDSWKSYVNLLFPPPKAASKWNGALTTSNGDGALDSAIQYIECSSPGQRNNVLYKQSRFLADKVISQNRLSESKAEEKLIQAAKQIGLEENEARKTIHSAFKKNETQSCL